MRGVRERHQRPGIQLQDPNPGSEGQTWDSVVSNLHRTSCPDPVPGVQSGVRIPDPLPHAVTAPASIDTAGLCLIIMPCPIYDREGRRNQPHALNDGMPTRLPTSIFANPA